MACVSDFGIIDKFEKDKDYSFYDPKKYDCISIDDDILNEWWSELILIKTYFHSYNRPSLGFDRWGITLIPPESLESFYTIISDDKRSLLSDELIDLMKLIRIAIDNNKYVIHYGV